MQNNRNFYITIALSVLILMVWQVFYMNPKIESQRQQAQIEAQRVAEQTKPAAQSGTTPTPSDATAPAGTGACGRRGDYPRYSAQTGWPR